VIVVGGAWGTLSEIAYAKILGRPVVILEPGLQVDGVERAASPEEAVDFVLARLEHSAE
jgi:predicted Rossmann-fold nucleotide-binding protein